MLSPSSTSSIITCSNNPWKKISRHSAIGFCFVDDIEVDIVSTSCRREDHEDEGLDTASSTSVFGT
ncbi:hypothetical protein LINPERHAP2_LOCUS215 [Linum perenne]